MVPAVFLAGLHHIQMAQHAEQLALSDFGIAVHAVGCLESAETQLSHHGQGGIQAAVHFRAEGILAALGKNEGIATRRLMASIISLRYLFIMIRSA